MGVGANFQIPRKTKPPLPRKEILKPAPTASKLFPGYIFAAIYVQRESVLHFSNLTGSEGKDRNGRQGGPPEARVGLTVLVSDGGGPCGNFCEILSQNRVERVADRMSAERCYRALRRRRTGEFATRAAMCVCARGRLRSALVWSRASARVRVCAGVGCG